MAYENCTAPNFIDNQNNWSTTTAKLMKMAQKYANQKKVNQEILIFVNFDIFLQKFKKIFELFKNYWLICFKKQPILDRCSDPQVPRNQFFQQDPLVGGASCASDFGSFGPIQKEKCQTWLIHPFYLATTNWPWIMAAPFKEKYKNLLKICSFCWYRLINAILCKL